MKCWVPKNTSLESPSLHNTSIGNESKPHDVAPDPKSKPHPKQDRDKTRGTQRKEATKRRAAGGNTNKHNQEFLDAKRVCITCRCAAAYFLQM